MRQGSSIFDSGSFRDPGGRVFIEGEHVYRALTAQAEADWSALSKTGFFRSWVEDGRLIGTRSVENVEAPPGAWSVVLEHDRVPLVSYPYEWTFSMLRTAALLHLDLLLAALSEDLILKDSTPFNIQFRGAQPVFIDIGSFQILESGDVWVGYRQFLQLFLYPLMLTAFRDIDFQSWLRGNPEGISAHDLRNVLSFTDLAKKGVPLHVTLQARGERRYESDSSNTRAEMREAGFKKEMIEANVRGLRKVVAKLDWKPGGSEWAGYADEHEHVGLQREAKGEFLSQYLDGHRVGLVWDVGANDGYFSKIAAGHAATVLAMDSDHLVVDNLYKSLVSEGVSNVLPMVHDVATPSPGLGWRGSERKTIEDRGAPDLVMCFAVVHHLVVGRNIPLGSVIDWLYDLGCKVIFEFVPISDPMVEKLTANKLPREIHPDYNEESLRSLLAGRFEIEREMKLPACERVLFALRPRADS